MCDETYYEGKHGYALVDRGKYDGMKHEIERLREKLKQIRMIAAGVMTDEGAEIVKLTNIALLGEIQ